MSNDIIVKEVTINSNKEPNSLSKISSIKVMDEQCIKDWAIKDKNLQIISSNGNEPLYLIEEDNDINIYSTTKLYERLFSEISIIKHKIVVILLCMFSTSVVIGILSFRGELMDKIDSRIIFPLILLTIMTILFIIERKNLTKVNKVKNYLFKNSSDFFKFKKIKNHKQIEDKNAEDKKQKINILL